MSFFDRLRSMFTGPTRIADGGDPEVDATLREEYSTAEAAEKDVEFMAETGGGGGPLPASRFGAMEAADVAEGELESQEAPSDPDA
jgi:hypothetical protein